MITITQTPNADSRTAIEKVSKKVLVANSQQHIQDVISAMSWMSDMILKQSQSHDWTKTKYIEEFYHDVKQSQDGFQGNFKEEHWYKDLHLQERHHLNDRVPDDVNLFDVLERAADITMAGLGRSGTIYDADIDPDILLRAFKNTIDLLKQQVEVK